MLKKKENIRRKLKATFIRMKDKKVSFQASTKNSSYHPKSIIQKRMIIPQQIYQSMTSIRDVMIVHRLFERFVN